MTEFHTARRLKDWYVPEHLMAAAVAAFVEGRQPYSMASDLRLPEGVQVLGVFHDHYRKSFVVRLKHDSFDPVPDGTQVPELVVTMSFRESPRDDADSPSVVGR